MKPTLLCIGMTATLVSAQAGLQFEAPVRLKAAGAYVSVESPGYASPALFDLDGDGKKDLVVGQFAEGRMKVYCGKGHGRFGKGKWLEVGGEIAKVPGVW